MTHKVSAIFENEASARRFADDVAKSGVSGEVALLADKDTLASVEPRAQAKEAGTKKKIAAGSAIGAGVGAAGAATAALAGVTVVVAAPVASALVAAGLGAMLGGAGTATASSTLSDSDFYKLVSECLDKGFVAVIVDTSSEAEALEVQANVERSSASASIDQSGAVRGKT